MCERHVKVQCSRRAIEKRSGTASAGLLLFQSLSWTTLIFADVLSGCVFFDSEWRAGLFFSVKEK